MRLLPLGFLALIGCNRAPAAPAAGLTVEWSGSHQGRFQTAALALWCARDSVLELVASRGDTGVGLAAWAADTAPTATIYPIVPPGVDDTRRPRAAGAVRWFGGTLIYGFEAASGRVEITRANRDTVSGTLEAGLRQTGGQDTLVLRGTFRGLAVAPAAEHCGRAGKPIPTVQQGVVSRSLPDSSPRTHLGTVP